MEACLFEQAEGGLVGSRNGCIELVEVEKMATIVNEQAEGLGRIAFAAIGCKDDDAYFGSPMARFEVGKVYHSNGLSAYRLDDEAELAVGVDVGGGAEKVIAEALARQGLVGCADMPQGGVVFDAVEEFEVVGFEGSEPDVFVS